MLQTLSSIKICLQVLEKKQNPHTLFISCSDSRLVPTLITKTLPGELFIIRNIANIVPFYRASDEFLSTTSGIEYAILVLEIQNIVICGHSNCGGCKAFFEDESVLSRTPHTRKWLELAKNVKSKIESENIADPAEKEWKTEQLNIVEQMNNLMTYPFINERYQNKTLSIFGWYYIIETGEVYNYDKTQKEFIKIE
ncbi:MAG: carbonic anhydrase [Victivallaceae bacterium]|jgi:carbonic anhydrase|nr:carbonic anhydrase [Victivallaceae bacterium]